MKNAMIIFEKAGFGKVRVINKDGQPWFVAKDVAHALGYKDTSYAITAHCKGVGEVQTPTKGGMQKVKIINEYDVYRLVMRSQLTEAEKFQDWVVEEVLPAIRKTGSYTITHRRARKIEHRKPFMVKIPASVLPPEEVTPSREDVHKAAADFMLLMDVNYKLGFDRNIAAIAANQVTARLTGVNMLRLLGHTQLESKIQEIFFTPTELGTKIGASGQEFNILLRDAGLQEKLDARWLPTKEGEEYSRIFDVGKRQKHGAAVQQVKWSLRVLELLQD